MKPITNAWALREVYFDENGEPGMHREPEQAQPVAWVIQYEDRHEFVWSEPKFLGDKTFVVPLYTIPPKREWVGMTDEEIYASIKNVDSLRAIEVARAIEAKLKEKNNG